MEGSSGVPRNNGRRSFAKGNLVKIFPGKNSRMTHLRHAAA